MSVNSVTLPPESNPLILAYQRITTSDARTPELQLERNELRLRFGELQLDCEAHFAKCDQVRIDMLLAEREDIRTEAANLLSGINTLQQKNAHHTSAQSRLQANLHQAQERLREFVPVNRTISSLQEIETNQAEQKQLQADVNAAKAALNANAGDIFGTIPGQQDRQQRYRALQEKEEQIAAQIEELQKPPSERKRPSSIVWQDGANVFGLQLPS